MKGFVEKLFIIEVILFAILGILFFINPFTNFVMFLNLCSVLLIIVGIFTLIRAFSSEDKIFLIINSIISILFGIILFFSPINAMNTLALFFGVFAIIRGIYLLIISFKYNNFGFNLNTLYNILLIIIGIFIVYNPFVAVLATPYIIGTYLLLTAIWEIYIGFKL